MIRFIDLGKQIAIHEDDPNWKRQYAFYDTLEARFLTIGSQQIFDSYEDVLGQLDGEDPAYMKRIMSLIPAWVPRGKPTVTR